MLAIWSEMLAEGPYKKNTPPAVRLEPAILRMQIQAFTNFYQSASLAVPLLVVPAKRLPSQGKTKCCHWACWGNFVMVAIVMCMYY